MEYDHDVDGESAFVEGHGHGEVTYGSRRIRMIVMIPRMGMTLLLFSNLLHWSLCIDTRADS